MTKKQFYISNLTWGLLLNIVGFIVALVILFTGHKPNQHGGCIYFNVGKNWGGVNLGLVFLTDDSPSEHTKNHEFGHAIQNAKYGLLMPFIVSIPSAIRYWYREIVYYHKGKEPPADYYSIWFEGEATKLGNEYIKKWEE
jgi:hypothetical protein